MVSLKSLSLNIGWAPFDDPVASRQVELSCFLPRFVIVDFFGIQPQPNYSSKPASADLRFTGLWGSVTSTMLSLLSANANTPRV